MPPGCCGPDPSREVHFHISTLPASLGRGRLSATKVGKIIWFVYVKEGCSTLCVKTHRFNFTIFFKLELRSWWWKVRAIPAGRTNLQHQPPWGGHHADGALCSAYQPLLPAAGRLQVQKTGWGSVQQSLPSVHYLCPLRCKALEDRAPQVTLRVRACGQEAWVLILGLIGSLACAGHQIYFCYLLFMFQF